MGNAFAAIFFLVSLAATVIAVVYQPWLLAVIAPAAYFMFRRPRD